MNIKTKQTYRVVRPMFRKHAYLSDVEYAYLLVLTFVFMKDTNVYMQFIYVEVI